MKKKLLVVGLLGLMGLMGLSGCSKEKTCRCSVVGSPTVRIIKIDGGNCEDIKTLSYHTPLDQLVVEELLCTDYEFKIDSEI